MPQIGQTCPNVFAGSSQNNFQVQQQQQPQQHQGQTLGQPMQTGPCAGGCSSDLGPFFPHPRQMDPYISSQPSHHTAAPSNLPFTSGYPYSSQAPYNITTMPSTSAAPTHPSQFNYVSPAATTTSTTAEQFRAYLQAPPSIFILPNNPTPVLQIPPTSQVREQSFNWPGARESCSTSPQYCCPPACIPYPYPMPMFNPFMLQSGKCKETSCCSPKRPECCVVNYSVDDSRDSHHHHHSCVATNDDTICAKINCPSAISLQALASQLLSIQGVISCTATRLVLRKIPGSNILNTMEEIVERACRTIDALTQDQLLAETRNAQQVNALINLHMAANPPANIIPVLTTIQLKVNILKSQVECLINRRISENQSTGAEHCTSLDPVILALKSDEELRIILATLRQKECDQRVNFNFAPYHSQRVIAETRLKNIQDKIMLVEQEMQRRRDAALPQFRCHSQAYGDGSRMGGGGGSGTWHIYPGTLPTIGPFRQTTTGQPQNFKSPDPFQIQVRNRKRLNLQPHVGSPETTYRRLPPQMKGTAPCIDKQIINDNNNNDNNKNNSEITDDDSANQCGCCSRSDKDNDGDDDDADDINVDKKKLDEKIDESGHVTVIGVNGEVVELEPGVVIVVDNPKSQTKKKKVNFAKDGITEIAIDQEGKISESINVNNNINNNDNISTNDNNNDKLKKNMLIIDDKIESNFFINNYEDQASKPEFIPFLSNKHTDVTSNETVRMITDVKYDTKSVAMAFETLFSCGKDAYIETEDETGDEAERSNAINKNRHDNNNKNKNDLTESACTNGTVNDGLSQRNSIDAIKLKNDNDVVIDREKMILSPKFTEEKSLGAKKKIYSNKIIHYVSSSSDDNL